MNDEIKLLPCPFCGGPAERQQGGEGRDKRYGYGCANWKCLGHQDMLRHTSLSDAATAWNTRAAVEADRARRPMPSNVNILGLAGEYIQPRDAQPDIAPQIINFARALLSRYGQPAEQSIQITLARKGRVYLAGPMTGFSDYNCPAFNAAAADLRAKGLHVENPAEHGIIEGAEWGDYLRYDIGRLALCETVYLLPGWSKSKGACLEVHIAKALGMEMRFLDGAEPAASAEPEWIDDPHDIEQGMMRNPKYRAPVAARPSVPHPYTDEMLLAAMEASVLGRPSVDDDRYVRSILDAAREAAPTPPATGQQDDDLYLDRLADYIADYWPDKKYTLEEIAQRLYTTWPAAFMPAQQDADRVDADRYRQARTMPFVLDYSRIAPHRPDKFDALIDAARAKEQAQ